MATLMGIRRRRIVDHRGQFVADAYHYARLADTLGSRSLKMCAQQARELLTADEARFVDLLLADAGGRGCVAEQIEARFGPYKLFASDRDSTAMRVVDATTVQPDCTEADPSAVDATAAATSTTGAERPAKVPDLTSSAGRAGSTRRKPAPPVASLDERRRSAELHPAKVSPSAIVRREPNR